MSSPSLASSLWHSVKAVAWSFLGIRRRSEFEADMGRISPFHLILVGLAGGLLFVLGLMALVNFVVLK
jgi:hypothetical protein